MCAGDELKVQHKGEAVLVRVPAGVHAGDSFGVSFPTLSKDDTVYRQPVQDHTQPLQVHVPIDVTVTSPRGAKPGDEVTVQTGGQSFHVRVPAGVSPGEEWEVQQSLKTFDTSSVCPQKRSASCSLRTPHLKQDECCN